MDILPEYDILDVNNTIDDRPEKYALFKNNDLISSYIRSSGAFQPDIMKICLKFMTDKTKNVLDIGANIGSFAIPVAKNITGTVFSFEVQRHIFMQLCTNCFLNRLANVYPIHGLVSAKEEKYTEVPIVNHYNSENTGSFSLNKEHIGFSIQLNCYLPPTIENAFDKIQTIHIDDLNIQNIGFIKIDVEGAELDVLKGMQNTIKQNDFPPLLFECSIHEAYTDIREKLFQFIQDSGYGSIYPIENIADNFVAFKKGFVIF